MAGFNYKSSNQIIERQQSKVFEALHKEVFAKQGHLIL